MAKRERETREPLENVLIALPTHMLVARASSVNEPAEMRFLLQIVAAFSKQEHEISQLRVENRKPFSFRNNPPKREPPKRSYFE